MIGKHQIVKLIALLLVVAACSTASADEWPQWRGPNRDGVWKEKGLVDKFESDQLEIRWRMPIGPGYSGPTVADGRVYVTDRLVEPKQVERVHCFDWESGIEIWSYEYDCTYSNISYEAGPRAAVTIDEGRAYSLGTMGHLHCFDAGTGTVHWKRDLNDEYNIRMPIWGISSASRVNSRKHRRPSNKPSAWMKNYLCLIMDWGSFFSRILLSQTRDLINIRVPPRSL